MVTALRPRRASAPPCAATACFTRSSPSWARAGPDPTAPPIAPTSIATDRDEACFMATAPIFRFRSIRPRLRFVCWSHFLRKTGVQPGSSARQATDHVQRAAFFRKTLLAGILGSKVWRLQEEAEFGPATGHHLGVTPPPPDPMRNRPQ